MKNTIALVSLLLGTHFAFAHASDGVKELKIPNGDLSVPASADEDKLLVTDDSQQFDQLVGENRVMTHVDFSSVTGQSAPLLVESMNESTVKILGSVGSLFPQAVTSYKGLPATYWFGAQAEPTFVFANGNVQIVFQQDVSAASMLVDEVKAEQMALPVDEDYKMRVTLLDANGNLIAGDTLDLTSNPSFLGITSDIAFRSVIIASTAGNWMFSDLNYGADGFESKITTPSNSISHNSACNVTAHECGAEHPTVNDSSEMPLLQDVGLKEVDGSLIPVNDPVDSRSAAG